MFIAGRRGTCVRVLVTGRGVFIKVLEALPMSYLNNCHVGFRRTRIKCEWIGQGSREGKCGGKDGDS